MLLVHSRYVPGALMVRYRRYVNFLLDDTVFSCTLEVQEVYYYYCSVEVFTIKFHPSAYFALLGKIDSPFCLQNCLFLLAAYFAQNSASKFCQGLVVRDLLYLLCSCCSVSRQIPVPQSQHLSPH